MIKKIPKNIKEKREMRKGNERNRERKTKEKRQREVSE